MRFAIQKNYLTRKVMILYRFYLFEGKHDIQTCTLNSKALQSVRIFLLTAINYFPIISLISRFRE